MRSGALALWLKRGIAVSPDQALEVWRILTQGEELVIVPRGVLPGAQGFRCYLCGRDFEPTFHGHATLDHVFPRTAPRRPEHAKNAVAHRLCNQWKGGRYPRPCEILFAVALHLDPAKRREPYDTAESRAARKAAKRARWKAMEAERQSA